MINPIFREMMANGLVLAFAGAATILFLWLGRPRSTTTTTTTTTTATVKRRRGVQLRQVNPPAEGKRETDTGIDIIAIHGLDTNSPHTWEFKKEDGQKINWLADQHMLPAEVPGTRIFTCDWPADLLETKDSVSLKIEELALSLLQCLRGPNMRKDRRILFIASCLGGIILMKALVEAKDDFAAIREATRGVIFLATPFRGTSFQDVAMWAQPGLRVRASARGKKVSKLLDWLNAPTYDLTRLVGQFTGLCKSRDHEGFEVFTFYETGYTYLAAQASVLSFLLPGSKKPLVDMSSATLDCVPNPLPLHRNHARMNKFCGPMDSDPDYRSVVEVIQRFLLTIQTGTPLEQADAWIREKHYDKQRLRIERLSGDPLKMDQCYINLALVQLQQAGSSQNIAKGSSPFSLAERLNVESPHEGLQVELLKLFQPRELPDGSTKLPGRVLIRGRAGVGKTTLCKKIVYAFFHEGMWQDLFKRVVWIRLRELKNLPNDNYNLDRVLKHIFFRQQNHHAFLPDQLCNKLCNELWRQIESTQSRDTLFLLDGLDEVPELTMEHRNGNPHPVHESLKGLLNRPNVIITTRPHATFPSDFRQPDLELETMGFSQDQVQTYIEAVMPKDKVIIAAYLKKNRLMKSLVQIPIQLDALCFTWQASSVWNNIIPETMTAVYEAMVRELWRKDNERLEKDGLQIIGNASPAETDPFDSTQYRNLGYLAFSGLCSNVIEFQPYHRNALYRSMEKVRTSLSFDESFARLSFWRTSDPSNRASNQSYHFIHLTFQEYFSAKHYVDAWRAGKNLKYVEFQGGNFRERKMSCHNFLRKYKFTARYNIMWRFVAGLLDDEEEQTTGFFEAIESEPVDLLGPTQQRLVMYCLAEVVVAEDLRTKLEEQLSQWVEFEVNVQKESQFVREEEFPERAMNLALERGSEKGKIAILDSLTMRRTLPLKTVEFITRWLEGHVISRELRVRALRALKYAHIYLPNRTLNAVIMWMDDKHEPTGRLVQDILKAHAPWPEDILSSVMARLESQDVMIKRRTARALQKYSMMPETLLRTIATWLEDRDEDVTEAVLETLECQSWLPKDVMPSIAAQLGDEVESISWGAFKALNKQERLPDDILDSITIYIEDQDNDDERRWRECRLSDNIIHTLTLRLKSQDTNTQLRAMRVLLRRCEPSIPDDVVQALVAWLQDRDRGHRLRALSILSRGHRLPESVIEAVGAHMKDQDQELRSVASEVFLNQEILSAGIFQNLIRWLEEEDKVALNALRLKLALSIDVFNTVEDGAIKKAALTILQHLATQQDLPDDALQAVVALLENPDNAIRVRTLEALEVFGNRRGFPHNVLQVLADHLEDPGEHIRSLACSVLANQSELPEDVLQAMVIRGLGKNDMWVDQVALRIILRRPTMPQEIRRLLVARFDDTSGHIRWQAVKVLASQVDLSEDILSAIAGLLQDKSTPVRLQAMRLLGAIPTLSAKIQQAVVRLVFDEDIYFSVAALRALGGQRIVPDTILNLGALYSIWLLISFTEDVYCYIEDGVSYLEWPSGFGKVSLQGQPNEIRKAILKRQRGLGMPMRSHELNK